MLSSLICASIDANEFYLQAATVVVAIPSVYSRSMAELLHQAPPERVRLPDTWIACLFPDRRVDHDEPTRRIDVDRLATYAAEREHPPLARQYPDLIAVAAGSGLRLAWPHNRGLLDPGRRDDLPAAPTPVVGEQQSQACIVAQHRIKAAERCLLARAVDEPGRASASAPIGSQIFSCR